MPHLGIVKSIVFLGALLPLLFLYLATDSIAYLNDPEAFVQRQTGLWTFNFLLLTLCVTPVRQLSGHPWIGRLRRMLGLFAFFYACLHLLSFIGFNHHFVIQDIAKDILKRPYVFAGLAAFAILVPLAATSNQYAIRRLGGRRWQDLHRGIYLASILAAVHFLWLTKPESLYWPLGYAIMLGLLLGWRISERRQRAASVPIPKSQDKPLRFFSRKPD